MAMLVKQFSWILVGRLAGAMIQAVSMALLARSVGPAGFSIFAVSYGIAIIIQTIFDFGLSAHIVRSRALSHESSEAGSALHLLGRINIAICILGLMLSGVASYIDPVFIPLIPLAVWLAADKQVEAWLGIPLADGRTWQNASSLIFRRGTALLFLLGGLVAGHSVLFLYCLGLAVGSITATGTVQWSNSKVVKYGQGLHFKYLLKKALPFYSNSVATQMRNLDTLLVGIVLSPVASGLYGAASRLTSPLRIVPTSFANILMPIATKRANGGDQKLLKPVLALLAITTLMYAVIAIAVPFVIPVLLGPAYVDAVPVIQIVCFGLIFAAIASQLNSLLQGWGFLTAVSWISWSTTAFCLIGISVLGPALGVEGAGVALASSYLVQVILQAIYILKNRRRFTHA